MMITSWKHKVADTNANPYVDGNGQQRSSKYQYEDTLRKVIKYTTKYGWIQPNSLKQHNIQSVGVTDKYDSANLTVNGADIKAYDSVTGEDVTAKFDIKVENGVITATSKADLTKSLGDAEIHKSSTQLSWPSDVTTSLKSPAEIKQSAQGVWISKIQLPNRTPTRSN